MMDDAVDEAWQEYNELGEGAARSTMRGILLIARILVQILGAIEDRQS